ncbi:hypothetical protein [Cellulomonas hominis]|uniref:hypothetical protein n=1 Tax=Cellulomonas hominis TaxID=156981 RepID=UPI00144497B6|nr:hypothetical protein [Cellulomonas hominis]NKY08948.1 hypothetical protein [Cellulomonas hominis]
MLAERTIRPTVLLDLIDGLTPGAALWRAIDPEVLWDANAMLLALLIDEVRVLRWEFERANFKGHKPPPEPLPRPGVAKNTGDTQRDVIGAGEGFDTIDEFKAWYAEVQASFVGAPEIDTRDRILPQRDARGRFVKG